MNKILKGNYELNTEIENPDLEKSDESEYRRKAINSIGGSMVYVERTPLKWDGKKEKTKNE